MWAFQSMFNSFPFSFCHLFGFYYVSLTCLEDKEKRTHGISQQIDCVLSSFFEISPYSNQILSKLQAKEYEVATIHPN